MQAAAVADSKVATPVTLPVLVALAEAVLVATIMGLQVRLILAAAEAAVAMQAVLAALAAPAS
jgi:hypothetical protein